jgi:hypothetical protein
MAPSHLYIEKTCCKPAYPNRVQSRLSAFGNNMTLVERNINLRLEIALLPIDGVVLLLAEVERFS